MHIELSFIIPVFNRPDETEELLESFVNQDTKIPFEIVIVEDGSTITSKSCIERYKNKLNLVYYYKSNSGPGSSRNFGMQHATGNYFIILDSDCILPPQYISTVLHHLTANYIDCFGGPDAAHSSFTPLQKAINYSMTSIFTTGGIRGGKKAVDRFQPRSFNMGISKKAFITTKGFGNIHPGEDPDLTIRLWKSGFKTTLLPDAFVYHKRRISWAKFYKQVTKFGSVRPILNLWHPQTEKLTYWFPSIFILGLFTAIFLCVFKFYAFIFMYICYFVIIFLDALIKTKQFKIAVLSILAVIIQFYGYGLGFFKLTFALKVLKKIPEKHFPELFFKTT